MTLTLLLLTEWALFLGRFHPLLVHLPIGFLLIALLLEVGQRMGKVSVNENTKGLILLASALGATLSCIAGLLLASGGGYDEEALASHQWQGIGVAVFAWLAWLANGGYFRGKLSTLSILYAPAFLISVVLMFFAGHVGGGLTHGDDYLLQYAPNPIRAVAGLPPREEEQGGEIKPLENVDEAIVYEDIVQPILTARCVQCHGRSKKKGGLRLDGYDYIHQGGEDGPVVVNGNGAESAIVKLCLLPIEDDMHMPPKGKTQLTDAQIGLISWWIDQGAPKDKKVAELSKDQKISASLAQLGQGSHRSDAQSAGVQRVDLSTIMVGEADAGTIAELRKQNLIVLPVSKDQNIIEVSAVNAPAFSDAQAALLGKLTDQIVWLKVGGTAISDAALKEIGRIKHLNKLHLEYTSVSDQGVSQLPEMPYLEYLNLIGTKVSDASIPKLASLKSLKSIYLWQSAVSDSGIQELKRLRPDLQVVGGLTEDEIQDFLQAGKKDSPESESGAE